MDPYNQIFWNDYLHKFVYQDPNAIFVEKTPQKPFSLDPPEKSEKPKKDLEKQKKKNKNQKTNH